MNDKNKNEKSFDELFLSDTKKMAEEDQLFLDHMQTSDWAEIPRKYDSCELSETKKHKKKLSKKFLKEYSIDLHGLNLTSAKATLNRFILDIFKGKGSVFKLKIITGRGIHSSEVGSRLYRDIPVFLRQKWKNNIIHVDESPADQMINGFPLKGYFYLILKK